MRAAPVRCGLGRTVFLLAMAWNWAEDNAMVDIAPPVPRSVLVMASAELIRLTRVRQAGTLRARPSPTAAPSTTIRAQVRGRLEGPGPKAARAHRR